MSVAAPVAEFPATPALPAKPFLRRHAPLLAVLAGAVALRAAFLVAYPYSFFYPDSRAYVSGSVNNMPGVDRPFGYSVFLKPFVPGHLYAAAVCQHVLALLLIVAVYVFLTRRGVRPWLAAVAGLPFALDAREVTLEHYLLAETLFLALIAAALMLLAWRERTGVLEGLAGGALLGAATLTRGVGLPLIGLAVVYLLVRRRWPAVIGLLVTSLLSLHLYASWYESKHQVYGLNQFQGRFLYARVMTVADCDRLKLADWERPLCSYLPGAELPDAYIWSPDSAASEFTFVQDPQLRSFATDVIKQQPGDYLLMVLRESSWHVVQPDLPHGPDCLAGAWLPPDRPDEFCRARFYWATPTPDDEPVPAAQPARPWPVALHNYGAVVTTPGVLYPALLLLAVVAAIWRPRRPGWRDAADALLFTLAGTGLVIFSVATSMCDTRYVLPAVLLVPVGGALAVHRILAIRRAEAPAASAETPEGDH